MLPLFSTGRLHQTHYSSSPSIVKTRVMGEFEYPLDTSWNIDIAQDISLPQDVASLISQRVASSGLNAQSNYQIRQRDASLHHSTQPWVVPSTGYASRRQHVLNNRRMRQVSTPHRSVNPTAHAPVDGLMIHVEKRARNGGLVAQIPLPSSLPSETSPVSRQSTNCIPTSRASSQSFAQDDGASAAASNGPITPAISPIYGTSPETTKPVMSKTMVGMDTSLQSSFGPGVYQQPYVTQNLPFVEEQDDMWDMADSVPQNMASYGFYNFPSMYSMSQQEAFVFSNDGQYLDDQYLGYRRNFTVPEQLKTSSTSKKPARKHFTPEVTNILKMWFKENLHRPYPSEETKQELLRQTGLTMNQLSNWFINARRRNWRRSRHTKDG